MKTRIKPDINDLLERSRELLEQSALSQVSTSSPLHHSIAYHLSTPGSLARSKLSLSASSALNLTTDESVRLAAAVESLHNASLIQDDLQDRDAIRRGKVTVWKKFGPDLAINATDLMLSSAFALAASAGGVEAAFALVNTMHQAVAKTLEGQTKDLSHEGLQRLEDAVAVAKEKSGPLFSLSLELPLVLSGHDEYLGVAREVGAAFGIGYQIFDDIQDRELDRAAGDRFNLALMIESVLSEGSCFKTAEQLAHHYLDQAATSAASLPNDCAALLREKCMDLLMKLELEAA